MSVSPPAPHAPEAAADVLHPVLRELFAELERRELRWSLLRVPSDPAAPSGDVDVLVAPSDAASLREAASELGFAALPGWDSAPNLILVFYDPPSDTWLLLDVLVAVEFRRPRGWQLPGAAEQVLAHRMVTKGMAVPADADAFWLLLLHCLLDKGQVGPHHRGTLRRLAPVGLQSPLAAAVREAAGGGARFRGAPGEPSFTPELLVEAARSERWDTLAALGDHLAVALRRRRRLRERCRVLLRDLAALARKPLLLPRRRGISLALIGPNGVGKSTAADGLRRAFPFESRVMYMGVWKAASATRGRGAAVAEILSRPMRIWLRYLIAAYHQLRGRLVVFDRYVYEALLPAQPPLVAIKRVYFWLIAHSLPAPRVVVVLDTPGDVAYGRKQENPPDELEFERRFYAQLPARVACAQLIDASADAQRVRAEITTLMWEALKSRWRTTP